jgi:hypothetical protein
VDAQDEEILVLLVRADSPHGNRLSLLDSTEILTHRPALRLQPARLARDRSVFPSDRLEPPVELRSFETSLVEAPALVSGGDHFLRLR